MASITSIKVTNHRCLVDFELPEHNAEPINLLVGESGSGQPVDACFPRAAVTRWVELGFQKYELDLWGEGAFFHYSVEVGHLDNPPRGLVRHEHLECNGNNLYEAKVGEVRLYDDEGAAPAKVFPFDSRRSYVSFFEPSVGRQRIAWFREIVGAIRLLKLEPTAITRLAGAGVHAPARNGADFAAWYRQLQEEEPDKAQALLADLQRIFTRFRHLRFRPVTPDSKELLVSFDAPDGATYDVSLEAVSDGQRALIVLYALLQVAAHKGSILFLDEPDNFVPLLEIHPWLARLRQAVEEAGGQLFVISHHPEVIDDLAPFAAFHFSRPDGGATQVRVATPRRAAEAFAAAPRDGEAERVPSLADARREVERLPR